MYLAEAALLEINATFWLELVAFLVMVGLLARYVYPRVIAAAEQRQKDLASVLSHAEESRKEAEESLRQAREQLEDARRQAQEVVAGAGRSADELRAEARQRADEEARRLVEKAQSDIETARQQAVDSVRAQVADLVVMATGKVVAQSIDSDQHRKLIQQAIDEVTGPTGGPGTSKGGNGR